jgi:hypothetical protein
MALAARRLVLIASCWLASSATAHAQSGRVQADIGRALTDLQGEDRVQRALGAIAAQHVIKARWRFSLLQHTDLTWWQRALAPAIPHLIAMLGDDSGLEWIDQNGMTENTTTPRKEAVLVLVGLERASVAPLIAALGQRELTRKVDLVLRQITGGAGPPTSDQAAWQTWWQVHQNQPLPREHGQLWKAALALLLLGGGVALVIWRQRRQSA